MGDNHDVAENDFLNPHKREQYDLNSKIMLTAIISLSLVVVLVTILHIYARCLLRRQTRQRAALSRLELAVTTLDPPRTGLDPFIIATLPMFPFRKIDTLDETGQTECAVCLSMLENDEMARMLPNCKHTFHAECIDKWLGSNSTCPICRSQVEPRLAPEPIAAAQPSAPSVELANSTFTNVEESTSENGNQNHGKINSESISRLSSFRRILSRERSSRRIQYRGQEPAVEDLERQ